MVTTLQIIGRKKSGKTTTMCHIIESARQTGMEVAAFKQTHHEAAMDVEGTDTFQFSQAGAKQVFMKKENHLFLHQQENKRQVEASSVTSEAELRRLVREDIDFLLFEGFKQLDYPKLLLLKPGETAAEFTASNICAVGSIYPEVVKEQNVLDLTSQQKTQAWFSEWIDSQNEKNDETDELTHFNEQQRAKMVDVSDKKETKRAATAICKVNMKAETMSRIQNKQIKKGDVLAVSQVAGIMAAKKTSELIPMCHLIALTGVDIQFQFESETCLKITVEAKATDATGVEMEALVACQIAALTVYDMCKAMDRGMTVTDCRLQAKSGGKSDYFLES